MTCLSNPASLTVVKPKFVQNFCASSSASICCFFVGSGKMASTNSIGLSIRIPVSLPFSVLISPPKTFVSIVMFAKSKAA